MPAEAHFFELPLDSGTQFERTPQRKLRADPYWAHFKDLSPERWEAKVVPKIVELTSLEEGWDGYHGRPVALETSMFAIVVLNNIMRISTPCPQIVPTSSGALQLEWHERQIDLEVKITAPYKCEIYFEDHSQPAALPTEIAFGSDMTPLMRFVDELASR